KTETDNLGCDLTHSGRVSANFSHCGCAPTLTLRALCATLPCDSPCHGGISRRLLPPSMPALPSWLDQLAQMPLLGAAVAFGAVEESTTGAEWRFVVLRATLQVAARLMSTAGPTAHITARVAVGAAAGAVAASTYP